MPVETPRPDGSLGPLYLVGALREIGIEADILDASIGGPEDTLEDTFYQSVMQPNGLIRIGMSWERIEEFLGRGGYDVVAITSNFTPQTNMAFRVAEIAKKVNPACLVVTGGVNARNLWKRFVANGNFDIICTTEAEKMIAEIIKGTPSIPGTIHIVNGYPRIFPPRPDTFTTNLDDLPMPAWDKLLLERYEKIASPHGVDMTSGGHRYAPMMTSRGCPFQCTYCHISMERFGRSDLVGDVGNLRLKSVQRVLMEIERLESLGVRKIWIEDDSLLAKKERIREIFTAIKTKGLTIGDVNGVNLVHFFTKSQHGLTPDREYMELLFQAGFQQIVFPVESGCQRILDKYATGKLNLGCMDIVELTRVASSVGIIAPVNIMLGFPDETEQEMEMSVELAKKLVGAGAPYVTFFLPIPFPGSSLYQIAIDGGHLSQDFDPDAMNWKNGILENTTVPRQRVIEIRDQAWERINTKEYIALRLKQSIGSRWQS